MVRLFDSGADPGFPVWRRLPSLRGTNLRRRYFLTKMYIKVKELGRAG